MSATLVILAAGLGSRYKGLKQVDSFGPSGEQLFDYTVYDAIRAGFDQVVFVIRKAFAADFEQSVNSKFAHKIDVRFVYQELDNLPEGCTPVHGREKPWGTGHALWVTKDVVTSPFCMVNADDFYGAKAIKQMHDLLQTFEPGETNAGMVGYLLDDTLSDFGSVSRGICDIERGDLNGIEEHTQIEKKEDQIISVREDGEYVLPPDTIVSMNLMGFSPAVYSLMEEMFKAFYHENKHQLKAEFYAPQILKELIDQGVQVPVTATDSSWFGVTYPEDKAEVQRNIQKRIQEGEYPAQLWE